ncbi:LysR substrate-binding protein [Burkholderia sp. lig30]|jgi:hypothetical protein|nr:LysR substrate-binding protein [Burkholderia sp. lig30]
MQHAVARACAASPISVTRPLLQRPGVALDTVRNTSVNLSDEMVDGRVDLAIGLLPQLKGGFYQRRLFDRR